MIRSRIAAAAWFVVVAVAVSREIPPPVVILPSGPTVPENLLRVELRFAKPLRTPLTMDDVALLDDAGHRIEAPFLDLPLPSADGRRVTVLLHPGRVKSGLQAHRELGRALHSGSTVTFVVDHAEIGRPVRRSWQVVAADAEPPRPSTWRWLPPIAGGCSDLVVQLDAPIGSAAESWIAVRGPDGRRVAGRAWLDEGETVWRFSPAQPWPAGQCAIVVHPDLEDPAGNRIGAAFETVGASLAPDTRETVLPFTIGPACARALGGSSAGRSSDSP